MVIVTEAMPKSVEGRFAIVDNVWICGLADARELAMVLRYRLIQIQSLQLAAGNKESSMALLYDFLTSHEFKHVFESLFDS